jgi:hypothetical protein
MRVLVHSSVVVYRASESKASMQETRLREQRRATKQKIPGDEGARIWNRVHSQRRISAFLNSSTKLYIENRSIGWSAYG